MGEIRVLVVDDSAFMRKVISDILTADPMIKIIATARNGVDAINKVQELKPDVVTLDIEMPEMDGIETLTRLMKTHPVPVVMISSLTQEGADMTIKALSLGAVDFIPKPSGSISLDIHKVQKQIVEKVRSAAKAKLLTYLKPTVNKKPGSALLPTETEKKQPVFNSSGLKTSYIPNLIVVGTSTGGPKALHVLLQDLPADLPAALLIVQHMPPGFTRSLAHRLDMQSSIRVLEAEEGMMVESGCAYIAPGNFHMEVVLQPNGQLRICLNQEDPQGGHRPSVDVLFHSIAKVKHPSLYAVILTGMGRDGTNGLKQIKIAGCKETIAEDESTCVVFGMPKAAILAGAIDRVLSLTQIGPYLVNRLMNKD